MGRKGVTEQKTKSGPGEGSWSALGKAKKFCASPEGRLGPAEWAKLIRKLRWIGLEDETRCLQLATRAAVLEDSAALPPTVQRRSSRSGTEAEGRGLSELAAIER
jgi:hypothetical protein